jgi:hypothetical protein
MSRIIAQKVLKKFTRLFVVWFLWLVCRCRLHGGLCDGGLTLSGYNIWRMTDCDRLFWIAEGNPKQSQFALKRTHTHV